VFYIDELSKAFGEYCQIYFWKKRFAKIPLKNNDNAKCLRILFNIAALKFINDDKGTFMENGYLNFDQISLIRDTLLKQYKAFKPYALNFVNASIPSD
jgi:hypothetical protein